MTHGAIGWIVGIAIGTSIGLLLIACWRHLRRQRRECQNAALWLEAICPPKRRFRVRADGWVRHDGGPCPLPDKCRVLIFYRGRGRSIEHLAGAIPDRWWQHEDGKWDVLWFRPLEDWRERAPGRFA